MSDDETFTYMNGLVTNSPFTHIAPIAASFNTMMLPLIGSINIKDRPIYVTHGIHDWMFNLEVAKQVLKDRGANLVYREINDLSHTYPREENSRMVLTGPLFCVV